MTLPILRPLGFGEILDRAFTLYRRNFALFVGTSLLTMLMAFAGVVVLGVLVAVMVPVLPGAVVLVLAALLVFGAIALYMIPWGALARQASQSYTGKPASLGDGLRAGRRAAVTLAGAGIIVVISLIVMMLLVSLVAYVLNLIVAAVGSPSLSGAAAILTVLGALAAVFLVSAIYFAVVPAVVVEGKGPMEAISRSQELAEGALPRIAGTMVVSMLITYLPVLALAAVTGGLASVTDGAATAAGLTWLFVIQQLLSVLIAVLTMPFLLSVIVVLYYDRRVRTEALDVQMATERLGLAGA